MVFSIEIVSILVLESEFKKKGQPANIPLGGGVCRTPGFTPGQHFAGGFGRNWRLRQGGGKVSLIFKSLFGSRLRVLPEIIRKNCSHANFLANNCV